MNTFKTTNTIARDLDTLQARIGVRIAARLSEQAERTPHDVNERLRFGFLFQGAALFDSLTVYDNVAFGLRAQGKEKESVIRQRSEQSDNTVAAHIGQLEDRIERKPLPTDIDPRI